MNTEQRNLYLFTMGKAVSILGSSIYAFVISLYVLKLTGSALNFATTLMLSVIPMIIVSPIAGVVADRVPKKWLVVGMDLLSGLLFLLLFMYTRRTNLSLLAIYSSTALLTVFTTFFAIALEASKPSLVSPQKLVRLNSLSKLIDSSSAILGPVVGGLVFALFDIRLFILFNGLSFLFSAFTEWFMVYEAPMKATEELQPQALTDEDAQKHATKRSMPSFWVDLREGWHFFSKNQGLLELFFLFVCLNFLLGFSINVPEPYIINQVLKMSPKEYGLINSMFPIGLTLGTLTVEQVMKRISYKKLLIGANGAMALLAGSLGLPLLLGMDTGVCLVYFSALNLLLGIGIAYVDVPIMTIMQTEIPRHLLGRVMSLVMSLVKVILPVALIVSGLLLNLMPVALIPLLGASVAFLYSCYLGIRGGALRARS